MNVGIYLRTPLIDDLELISSLYQKSKSLHEPWVYPPKIYVEYLGEPHRYFLCYKNTIGDEEVVGTFNISGICRGYFQSGYLGYEVFLPHHNKGYMKAGIKLIVKEAFETLKLHRIEANIQPENTHSIKLVAQAGFKKEGYSKHYLNIGGLGWKDHERWALVNENWGS